MEVGEKRGREKKGSTRGVSVKRLAPSFPNSFFILSLIIICSPVLPITTVHKAIKFEQLPRPFYNTNTNITRPFDKQLNWLTSPPPPARCFMECNLSNIPPHVKMTVETANLVCDDDDDDDEDEGTQSM